jgi:hypothetical protein
MLHLGAPVLVTVDIKSFFPTISNRQVYRVWREALKCSPEIAGILTKLTTFERHLPQGSPASSLLANLVLTCSDTDLWLQCMRLGVTYSTWVDDLAFSGGNAREVIAASTQCLQKAGFAISHKKLKLMGPGTRKVLNGVLLSLAPSVLPERLSQLRSAIHKVTTREVPEENLDDYLLRVRGRITYVGSINPKKGTNLQLQLQSALGDR